MTALLIILAIIAVILLVPFGVAADYAAGVFTLAARVAFVNIRILPRTEKPGKEKPPKEKKPKKPKKRRPEGAEEPEEKPTPEELLALARLELRALSRFRRKLTVNRFVLRFVSAAEDPYDAAMRYGYVNTALTVLEPQARQAFRVLHSDVQTSVDFEGTSPRIEAGVTVTINLARILAVALYAGAGYLKLQHRKKKDRRRKKAAEQERMDRDGTADADVGNDSDEPLKD